MVKLPTSTGDRRISEPSKVLLGTQEEKPLTSDQNGEVNMKPPYPKPGWLAKHRLEQMHQDLVTLDVPLQVLVKV